MSEQRHVASNEVEVVIDAQVGQTPRHFLGVGRKGVVAVSIGEVGGRIVGAQMSQDVGLPSQRAVHILGSQIGPHHEARIPGEARESQRRDDDAERLEPLRR
ncbi:hypothetical protein D3C87_1800230 [compost metagenome]